MTTAKNDVILLGYNLRGDIDFWWVGREGGVKIWWGGGGFFRWGGMSKFLVGGGDSPHPPAVGKSYNHPWILLTLIAVT